MQARSPIEDERDRVDPAHRYRNAVILVNNQRRFGFDELGTVREFTVADAREDVPVHAGNIRRRRQVCAGIVAEPEIVQQAVRRVHSLRDCIVPVVDAIGAEFGVSVDGHTQSALLSGEGSEPLVDRHTCVSPWSGGQRLRSLRDDHEVAEHVRAVVESDGDVISFGAQLLRLATEVGDDLRTVQLQQSGGQVLS